MNRRTLLRTLPSTFLLGRSLFAINPAQTQSAGPVISESIEWTWSGRPSPLDATLPNVMLIGDSITRAYHLEVSRLLAGKANCYLFATSAASGDPRLTHQLEELTALFPIPFAIVHFNNGMHGWGYTEAQYASGLPTLLSAIRRFAPESKLIWASTTPVRKDSTTGSATNARIVARNLAAATLMQSSKIPIDDQHALMLDHQNLHADDVHFNPDGSAIQAAQVFASLLPLLAAK